MIDAHILAFSRLCKHPQPELRVDARTQQRHTWNGHAEGKALGVSSNKVDNIGGLQRGPQICLNGNDSERLNHTRTTHRLSDHNTPRLGQAGKTHTSLQAFHRVTG